MSDDMENIRIKVMDFDVFDIMKNQTDDDGNQKAFDPQILLIENLDKKVTTKFNSIDGKTKLLETSSKELDNNMKNLQDKNVKLEKALKSIGESLNKSGGGGGLKLDFGEEDVPNYARMEEVIKYVDNKINE